MSDILSSASLLLAALAMVFSVWYGEIKSICDKNVTHNMDNLKSHKEQLWTVFMTRGLPLFIVSLLIGFIYLPFFVSILVKSYQTVFKPESGQTCLYNPIDASLVLVVLLTFGIAFVLFCYLIIISKKICETNRRIATFK